MILCYFFQRSYNECNFYSVTNDLWVFAYVVSLKKSPWENKRECGQNGKNISFINVIDKVYFGSLIEGQSNTIFNRLPI